MPDILQTLSFARPRLLPLPAMIILLLWLPPAGAGEGSALDDTLLEFVGLTAQINRSAATIIDETTRARLACEDEAPYMQTLADFLGTLYTADELRLSARELINAKLSEAEKNELHDWMQSPLGQKVYIAEAATENQDLAAMEKREKALVVSPAWTEQRQKHIYRVLRVTRVHHYVAALNTSLTSVVKMASACQQDNDSLDAIDTSNRQDRVDEKFVGLMMLSSFVVPTGVVFEALSDDELHEYFLFSSTPTAQKWYGVVIDTVRSVLLDRVPAVRAYLQRG